MPAVSILKRILFYVTIPLGLVGAIGAFMVDRITGQMADSYARFESWCFDEDEL